ncbi:MAG: Gfo/Idh/MocA family oxidoreductase [Deltaproteobacteria bacterium]|nr:Gfo/Idh/MocA family oxidoreductase [Deltaproteobacteria bacterium]
MSLRYGIVGGGFLPGFMLRALTQVRGVEVAGLVSRTPPEALARFAREHGLGPARVFGSIAEMAPHVDVVAFFGPNFTRVEAFEQVAAAVRAGARLSGLICEKPLARNLGEARRVLELAREIGAPTAYFENQIHMKSVSAALAQLAKVIRSNGPLVLARAAEEHGGPHGAWFWDPRLQGGGVLSDMGCHSIALAWHALTPPGKPPRFLEPVSVLADVALLKWGQPRHRAELLARHGVDYAKVPAEDFATGLVTFRNPETGQLVKGQFTVSWMYDKQGLRLLLDGIGPGYALESNSLRSPLEIFVSDAAAAGEAGTSDAELALEKAQATRGLLAVQPNEPDLYGYTDENADAIRSFAAGRSGFLDFEYGVEIVRLVMAAYLSAERGSVVDLRDAETRDELERYVPLIQQGRGAELLLRPRIGDTGS